KCLDLSRVYIAASKALRRKQAPNRNKKIKASRRWKKVNPKHSLEIKDPKQRKEKSQCVAEPVLIAKGGTLCHRSISLCRYLALGFPEGSTSALIRALVVRQRCWRVSLRRRLR
ncbi:MAG: hypothetical protein ACREPR_26255, partial [Brasilonema sp.]